MRQLRLDQSQVAQASLARRDEPVRDRQPSREEIVGHKGSVFYRAHSYHTKVPPEGIAKLVEHFTDPGGIVVDPFCGSGMTGIACMTTGRRGVLSDLSPAASHIASGYTTHTDPEMLRLAGDDLLYGLAELEDHLYGTICPQCSRPARVEYTVWSDVFGCPSCGSDLLFWDHGVDHESGSIRQSIECRCGASSPKRGLVWRCSQPVFESIGCPSCTNRVQHDVDEKEKDRLLAFGRDAIQAWYPDRPFEDWREMWRGQHRTQGILTAADFYTPRNLHGLAEIWQAINNRGDSSDIVQGLRFAFTAIVNRASRRYQWNPKRPTNVLSSTMYIASLSYEFNVFSLIRRKLSTAVQLYAATESMPGTATVHKSPAQHLEHIPDQSVDYVFTDPPFGSNIFYADSSFLWEAWLDETTDTSAEAVVHRSQKAEHGGKSIQEYEKLMAESFEEIARILRINGWASVMFHNSSDEVWSALDRAIDSAGFEVAAAVAFDKSQSSFKGLKGRLAGEKVPNFDLVLHVRRRVGSRTPSHTTDESIRGLIELRLRDHVATAPPSRRATPYLHSLAMRVLLEHELPLDGFSYTAIESLCAEMFVWDGSGWTLSVDSGDPT